MEIIIVLSALAMYLFLTFLIVMELTRDLRNKVTQLKSDLKEIQEYLEFMRKNINNKKPIPPKFPSTKKVFF